MLKYTRPQVSYLDSIAGHSADPGGGREVQSYCMLREELDFYLLKFVDEDENTTGSSRNLFKMMRSSVTTSRKSVEKGLGRATSTGSLGEGKIPNLSGFGSQIKKVCLAFFKAQLKVQTMSDFSTESKKDTSIPLGQSSFSKL
jgi:hypothetical protein